MEHINNDPTLEDMLGLDELDRRAQSRRHLPRKAPGSWKPALGLRIEMEWFVRHYGLDHCGLLTLLFQHPGVRTPIPPAKAQSCFKKAWRTLLPKHFIAYIAVLDYHRAGAIHFHLLVACKHDLRQGWNFQIDQRHRDIQARARAECRKLTPEELQECRSLCKLMTTSPAAKSLWKDLRKGLSDIGFPKAYPFELKPVRDPAALSSYLASRYQESRGRRDLRPPHSWCRRYSRSCPRCVDGKQRFSPVGTGATRYRRKKAAVAAAFGIHDIERMIETFGQSWEHSFREILRPVNPLDQHGLFDFQRERLAELVKKELARQQRNSMFNPPTPGSVLDDLIFAEAKRSPFGLAQVSTPSISAATPTTGSSLQVGVPV